MANHDYYNSSPFEDRLTAPLPPIPKVNMDHGYLPEHLDPESPPSWAGHDAHFSRQRHYSQRIYESTTPSPYEYSDRNPFTDDAALEQQHHPKPQFTKVDVAQGFLTFNPQSPAAVEAHGAQHGPRDREKTKKAFFSRHTPWFIYLVSTIQVAVFVAELVRNAILTGTPIEIHPSFNPMIGPSPYVLINMGARYVSCMRNMQGVQNSNTSIAWPCPNQTTSTPTCTLSELCGFNGVPNPQVGGSLTQQPAPDQWWRFIAPILIHAGIVHITFNLILQLLLGGDMERAIGPVRMAIVYFSSGIFGFVLGGNFAASGIESCGASGAIFGIIALNLLDILYTWQSRPKPIRDLAFIFLDIAISFVLGLLPGLDNFSHIGGFLMGLVLGICLLRSPAPLQKRLGNTNDDKSDLVMGSLQSRTNESQASLVPKSAFHTDRANYHGSTNSMPTVPLEKAFRTRASSITMFKSPKAFFSGRRLLWWAWWLLRVGALVGVVVVFIVLLNSFYAAHDTLCPGCKYLSCLPVSNWCEIGQLTFNTQS